MIEEVISNSKVYDKDGNLVGQVVKVVDDEGNVTIKVPVIQSKGTVENG